MSGLRFATTSQRARRPLAAAGRRPRRCRPRGRRQRRGRQRRRGLRRRRDATDDAGEETPARASLNNRGPSVLTRQTDSLLWANSQRKISLSSVSFGPLCQSNPGPVRGALKNIFALQILDFWTDQILPKLLDLPCPRCPQKRFCASNFGFLDRPNFAKYARSTLPKVTSKTFFPRWHLSGGFNT